MAAPRRLSQPSTSFIGTVRQGIPHVLFVTLSLLKEITDALIKKRDNCFLVFATHALQGDNPHNM